MLLKIAFFFARLGLRFSGAVTAFVGTAVSAVSVGNLYMVFSGQVRPGELIYPDTLAMPVSNSIGGLLVGIVLVIAGYWLYRLAVKVQVRG
jgi:hypothetical protein